MNHLGLRRTPLSIRLAGAAVAALALAGCSASGAPSSSSTSPDSTAPGSTAPGSTASAAQDDAALALVDDFVDAFNAGDATALARTFADDAEFVSIYGSRMSGRDGIESGHAAAFASRLDGAELVVDASHVIDVDGVRVVQAEWSLQHAADVADASLLVPEGSGVLTFSVACPDDDACRFASGANVRTEAAPR